MVVVVNKIEASMDYTLDIEWRLQEKRVFFREKKMAQLHREGVVRGLQDEEDVWSFMSPELVPGNVSVSVTLHLADHAVGSTALAERAGGSGERVPQSVPGSAAVYQQDIAVLMGGFRRPSCAAAGGVRGEGATTAAGAHEGQASAGHSLSRGLAAAAIAREGASHPGMQGEGACGQPGGPQRVDLSIVLSARDDGHGDGAGGREDSFLARLRNALDSLSKYSWEDAGVSVEVVLVSWADSFAGKPADRVRDEQGLPEGGAESAGGRAASRGRLSSLMHALGYRLGQGGSRGGGADAGEEAYWHDANVVIRVVLVPQEAHDAVYNPLGLGLLQYVSKNVGMRRACGRWLLVTNADCLLSADLARFIQHLVSPAGADGSSGDSAGHEGGDSGRASGPGGGDGAPSFYLTSRHDLPGVPTGGFPFDTIVVVSGHDKVHPLAQVSRPACTSPFGCLSSLSCPATPEIWARPVTGRVPGGVRRPRHLRKRVQGHQRADGHP
jgi:hypothetical protein